MKKLLFIMMLFFSLSATAQNAHQDNSGNYTAISKDTTRASNTGKTFTDAKGIVYPVYVSTHRKLFINKVSAKTGKPYKLYLKL